MVVDTRMDETGGETGGDTGGLGARERRRPEDHAEGMQGAGGPDVSQVARDWITLWQSEMSAMAADPEIRESWQAMMAIWAGAMSALVSGLPRQAHDRPDRPSRPADATRPAAAAAAPDPRDAEIDRLARHVAALERRLAELERGDSKVDPGRRPRRKTGR
ncbi:MAG TPA: hypothetical protein VE690_00600 [Rhodopila sp.]|nr:hypothetical protein [Rhodopila sp.]